MSNTSDKKSNGEGNGKPKKTVPDATQEFEEAVVRKASRRAEYILRLYVTGLTPRSLKAISNLKRFCEEHFPDDYELEVIDIYKNPNAAREANVIAAPTLIKKLPEPLRRFVGDLSNTHKLLVGMGLYK